MIFSYILNTHQQIFLVRFPVLDGNLSLVVAAFVLSGVGVRVFFDVVEWMLAAVVLGTSFVFPCK